MPTDMSMNDLIAPAQQGSTLPLQHGMQLASMQQDTEAKQAQTQNMQQQLDQAKWTSFKGRMGTFLQAAPPVQKAMKPGFQQWMQQQGYDPAIVDAAHDEDYGRNIQQAMQWDSQNPGDAAKGIQALGNVSAFDTGLSNIMEMRSKEFQARDLKEAALNASMQNATTAAQGRVQAAQVSQGTKVGNLELRAGNAYNQQVGPAENSMLQANRALGIIDKIDDNELKSTKTLQADLNKAQAMMLAGGKNSTVAGEAAVTQDTLYGKAMDSLHYVMGQPQSKITSADLNQLKLDIGALKDFQSEQHMQKYQSFRETVPGEVQDKVDNRFNKFRENMGLEGLPSAAGATAAGSPSQSSPPAAPPASVNKYDFTAVDPQKLKLARAAGYSDDQIASKLGLKPTK